MVRRMRWLLKGASLADLNWMLQFESVAEHCHVYNHDSKTIQSPGSMGIPWTVVWLLGRFHRKHILCNSNLPDIQLVARELRQFQHRVKWRWLLRNNDHKRLLRRVKKTPAVPCNELVDPALSCWLGHLNRVILRAVKQARENHRHDRGFSNVTPLTKLCLKHLRESEWRAVANDKEGGFTLETIHDQVEVHKEILAKKEYCEVAWCTYENILKAARLQCVAAAGEAERASGMIGLQRAIVRYMVCEGASNVSGLRANCKTHKPQGGISHRGIHCTPKHNLVGLGLWVSACLRARLSTEPYSQIIADSRQFKKEIEKLTPTKTARFAKVDIKDYFMSGAMTELVEDTLRAEGNGPVKEALARSLEVLLDNQYVVNRLLPQRTWKVVRGSGTGLVHSGETCDLALANLAEVGWLANSEVRKKFGILGFWRFRDDSLVIFDNIELFKECIWEYKRRAKYFEIVVEEINSEVIGFLDLTIKKGKNKYEVYPKFKEESLKAHPLCISSAHTPGVHRSWAAAQIKRFSQLASNESIAKEAKSRFIQRFINHFAPEALIDHLRSIDPWRHSVRPHLKEGESGISLYWIPIGFHPCLRKYLNKALGLFNADRLMKELYRMAWDGPAAARVNIAWMNTMSCVGNVVTRQ